jgi:hypothetical protein
MEFALDLNRGMQNPSVATVDGISASETCCIQDNCCIQACNCCVQIRSDDSDQRDEISPLFQLAMDEVALRACQTL